MKLMTLSRTFLAIAFAIACFPAIAGDKKFLSSDDGKEKEDPQDFLKDYDKLVKGKEADWVYFAPDFNPKSVKTVTIKDFKASKGSHGKGIAEDGKEYVETWIDKQGLDWKVVPSGGDLTIEGNIANSWEPSGGARFWGGWMANPGACVELMAKSHGGEIAFEMRQKSRGSTGTDALENSIEKMLEEVKKRR